MNIGGLEMEPVSVVIVEDDHDLAALYERYLQDIFAVETATTGTDALRLIDETVDVVLLDRQLPDINGKAVLEALRDRGLEVPVAMVTGVEPDTDIVEMPFDEYLCKPIRRETLIRTVRVLANRGAFERKSREFFRLAAKKASLGNLDDRTDYHEVRSQLSEIQTELDDTVRSLFYDEQSVRSRSEMDQREVEQLLQEVVGHTLPAELKALIDDYQRLQNARPPFMWKWVHRLAPQNTLPAVEEQYVDVVPVDKTITILFITLLDDLLEKTGDRATFDELAKIPRERQSADETATGVDTEYVAFASRVWEQIRERIQRGPNYDTYEELFRYDVEQAINSIEYSDIAIRRPDLSTMDDLKRYESHNMVMFAYADIDLMHSSAEVHEELGPLREAIWTAQLMARIGNWVSTWEREIKEGDYSSGPVVYALDRGIIDRDELVDQADGVDGEIVDRIKNHGVEKEFLTRWEQHYHELRDYNRQLSTIDLEPFIEGTEEVLRYHLASTGLK